MKRTRGSNRDLKTKHRRRLRSKPGSWCVVYVLQGEDGLPRYVGQTRQRLDERLRWHLRNPKQDMSKVAAWIRQERQFGRKVIIRALDGDATWDVSEIIWIERLRVAGADLLNMTRGGRDALPTTPGREL